MKYLRLIWAVIATALVALVEFVTRGRVRGQHYFWPAYPSLRWWYTGTMNYGHGGWICLNRNWFSRHGGATMKRNRLTLIGLSMIALAFCLVTTGCAGLPVWLTDAENLLPLFLASAGSVLAAVGTLTGNPEFAAIGVTIANIVKEVQAGIATVEQMVAAYKANPSGTALQNVENAAQAVITNLNALLGDFGLPAAVSAPFTALAQLLLSQFEAWMDVITGIKASVAQHTGIVAVAEAHAAAAQVLNPPMTASEYTAAHNSIVAQYPESGLTAI